MEFGTDNRDDRNGDSDKDGYTNLGESLDGLL